MKKTQKMTPHERMRYHMNLLDKLHKAHDRKKNKPIKDEGYGTTGGSSNPPLSKHLTPTQSPIYGSWI